jgi:hypothetical protein
MTYLTAKIPDKIIEFQRLARTRYHAWRIDSFMVSSTSHGIRQMSTIRYAIKKWCLAPLPVAGQRQTPFHILSILRAFLSS